MQNNKIRNIHKKRKKNHETCEKIKHQQNPYKKSEYKRNIIHTIKSKRDREYLIKPKKITNGAQKGA